jgi:hypothetical protein
MGETVSDVWEIVTRITGRHESTPLLTKAVSCPDMTCMEKLRLGVWKHPDERQCHLTWHLPQKRPCVEDGMHCKVLVIRGSIKVLECLTNVLGDVQPLCTFFRDFSHQGLFWSLSFFNTSSGEPEMSMLLDGRHPAFAVSYHSIDGSPSMIRVSVYLLTEVVLHLNHDG